jgi:hypothetical protein
MVLLSSTNIAKSTQMAVAAVARRREVVVV